MARRAQTGPEALFLVAGAILLAFVILTVVRTQFLSSGASNVQADAGGVATALASFSPSLRAGNVSAPPGVAAPTACSCQANSTCPAGQSLFSACTPECVGGGCIPCNARCGFGCQALSANGQSYVLTDDLAADSTCFAVSGNGVSVDCAGHSITGSGPGAAFLLDGAAANGFKLVNCSISGFSVGVNITGANNANVSGNAFHDVGYAAYLKGSQNFFAANNSVNWTRVAGFYLSQSTNANIQHNRIMAGVYPDSYGVYLTAKTKNGNFSFNSVEGGACAFFNCIDGGCGSPCLPASGTCANNTFTGNAPQLCTSQDSPDV